MHAPCISSSPQIFFHSCQRGPCTARTNAEDAEPEWRAGHHAKMQELAEKNRQYIKKKGRGQVKPGAEPKDWQIGDIVSFAPRRCGTAGKPRGVAPQKEVFRVVGRRGRGSLKFFKLRGNSGVLQVGCKTAMRLGLESLAAAV